MVYTVSMRFRIYPTVEQEAGLREHCAHARFLWNLALEQMNLYRPEWGPTPSYVDQARQLTEARKANDWLASGSTNVQQQALRDLRQAFQNWWGNPGHFGRPSWRKAGLHEGFRQVAVKPHHIERVSRRWATLVVPKIGKVRFRITRSIPVDDVKSYRVIMDRRGRWHVCFALIPDPIEGPGDGTIVGIDRGIAVDYQSSDGRRWDVPALSDTERRRLRLERKLARQQKGSNRRARTKLAIARIKAREADRRKDAIEKATTELARTVDMVRIEDLKVRQMMRSAKGTVEEPGRNVRAKAGLNRSIAETGWTMFATRLGHKIGDRLQVVPAAYTSQRCSCCGHTAPENRESQAVFKCVACGHRDNADVNAAKNIAAGHAVRARGESPLGDSMNREPTQDAAGVSHAA